MVFLQLMTAGFFGIAAGVVMFAVGIIILSPKDFANVSRFFWRKIFSRKRKKRPTEAERFKK
jgi:hypothetical protein